MVHLLDTARVSNCLSKLLEDCRWRRRVSLIPKYSVEDISLCLGNEAGEITGIPVSVGCGIDINVPGLHDDRKSHLA